MKRIIILFIIISLSSTSCRERQRKGAFQGVWYKQGYDTEAFVVRGDSMYYPGLNKGYYYDFKRDTLMIDFTERESRSIILSFSSRRIVAWDMTNRQDTILLQRRPSSSRVDTLSN